ncbi:Uncharacterised protein [Legionella beliardensis]|uniref:Uncharacterized protein n=1 Tax=Legionella beliardensis TaxID=91822 RepID=A0A378JR38_9GAMM|nr:hypothetical protein [Legionella beliardensis]STX55660.1 Uncharacterised protein [Legionella beliardensis]
MSAQLLFITIMRDCSNLMVLRFRVFAKPIKLLRMNFKAGRNDASWFKKKETHLLDNTFKDHALREHLQDVITNTYQLGEQYVPI